MKVIDVTNHVGFKNAQEVIRAYPDEAWKLIKSLEAKIQAMQEEKPLQWISLKDKVPEFNYFFYLVGRNKDCIASMEAQYIDGKFYIWRSGDKMEFIEPTHWAELPLPEED